MLIKNIYEAKAKLSEMVNKSLEGEDVYISKSGNPVAKIVPMNDKSVQRKPGTLRGEIKVKKGFYESDKEIEKMFYGE